VVGEEKDYLQLATDLARKVLSDLRLPANARRTKLPTVSAAALKLYLRGRQSELRFRDGKDIQDFNQALSYFERALGEEPRYALAYVGLGDLYQLLYVRTQKREDFAKTLSYYELAFQADPNSAETNAGLGWAYFFRGDDDKSYEYFKRAFESAPESPSVNINVGSFFRSIGLPRQAVRFYTKAIDLGGFYSEPIAVGEVSGGVYRLRAISCERLGETDNAVADAKRWLEMEPDSIDTELFYARMLVSARRLTEAGAEIAVAEKVDPGNPNTAYTKALLLAARGEKDQALSLIQEPQKDPFFYSYLLSRVYAACGLKDEAIRVITLGIEQGFQKLRDYFYEYPFLMNCYFYDNLRSDVRFLRIVEQQKQRYEENLKKYGGL
jgi:tetratricopeptide (TPR) repeat protein